MKLELIIENARIADVVRQRLFRGWFGLHGGNFVLVEEGSPPSDVIAEERRDAGGAVAQPGLIDAHMHIESSLLTPGRFAEAVLPWGTTTILQDPHEIGNVLGAAGVGFMIEAGKGLPLNSYAAVPSCIPATSGALETPNAKLEPSEVTSLAADPDVIALGEMMDYQGLLQGNPRLEAIIEAGRRDGLSLEGHVPTLSGIALSRYIAFGIRSDHTLMTPAKMAEELSKGLYLMLQEKSVTPETIAFVRSLPDRSRILLVTDDVMPNRLLSGHLDRILNLAVECGLNPLDALASATLRPAGYLGLRQLGMIAPGYRADFCLCRDLNHFPALEVYSRGVKVAEGGKVLFSAAATTLPAPLRVISPLRPANGKAALSGAHFRLDIASPATVRVIRVNDTNTFTELETRSIQVDEGVPVNEELVLATVIARSELAAGITAPLKVSLLAGLNLDRGAFASSFSHDSHNLLVVGKSPQAMAAAANAIVDNDGGMVVVTDDDADGDETFLPLPIAGLLSDAPAAEVAERFEALESKLRQLGMTHKNPILLLTILPLTVSPKFKISDRGIVDVEQREVLELLA